MPGAVQAHRVLAEEDAESRRAAGDQECSQRVSRLPVVSGDDKNKTVGPVGEGDEVLLTGDQPVVAVAIGRRVHVAAGSARCLGQAERHHGLPGRQPWDNRPLLRRTELSQRPPDAVCHVHQHPACTRAGRGRLQVGQVVRHRERVTAVLGRHRQAVHPGRCCLSEQALRDGLGRLNLPGSLLKVSQEEIADDGHRRRRAVLWHRMSFH